MAAPAAPLRCINEGGHGDVECEGEVQYRRFGTGKAFPRCDAHWTQRVALEEQLRQDYPDSPIAPAWFDPEAAGERWDDDY